MAKNHFKQTIKDYNRTCIFDQIPQYVRLFIVLSEEETVNGHELGILKEYMQDLIEQARQESITFKMAGYQNRDYSTDEAIMDLLSLIDDRIESEGLEIGLPGSFPHQMWETCNQHRKDLNETTWLRSNLEKDSPTKERLREITYRTLIELIEKEDY